MKTRTKKRYISHNRSGFAGEILMLFVLLAVVLKFYIAYRAWNLTEESIRQQQGLPQKQTATEYVEELIQERAK